MVTGPTVDTAKDMNRQQRTGLPRGLAGFTALVALQLAWLAAIPTPVSATEGSTYSVRPISPAEREAVRLGIEYLSGRSAVWWEALAESASLRALGRETALAEIEVRLGPRKEVIWELQTPLADEPSLAIIAIEYPSGLDEVIFLWMVQEGEVWKLHQIQTRAEVAAQPSAGSRFDARQAVWTPLLMLLTLALGAVLTRLGPGRRWVVVGTATALSLVILASCRASDYGSSEAGKDAALESGQGRLAPLQELRTTLARGVTAERLQELLPSTADASWQSQVASLWKAQYYLLQSRIPEFHQTFRRVTLAENHLVALLRARLALLEFDAIGAAERYAQAAELAPLYDSIVLEQVAALDRLGDFSGAEGALEIALGGTSRAAEVYYGLARLAASGMRREYGEKLFRTGWNLAPVERRELFRDPFLSFLMAHPSLFPTFSMDSALEPVVRSIVPRTPLQIPGDATATLLGSALEITTGDAKILIPGGVELAPQRVPSEDAATRNRRNRREVLDSRVGSTQNSVGGSLLQRRRRQALEDSVSALLESRQWDQVLDLTGGYGDELSNLSPTLAKLRAVALTRRGKRAAARGLLVSVAKVEMKRERSEPATLYQLADLFAADEQYDLAIRLIKKADRLSPYPIGANRAQQIELERDLSQWYERYLTEHFELRYPQGVGEKHPREVAAVLEEEFRRLQRWIPVQLQLDEPIEVHLFPIRDFMRVFGGMGVVGLFDGKVRVPLADLYSLHPQIVSILTHELAHGMITRFTDDQAPHWFQEGLAQHVQMVQNRVNPIPDLMKLSRFLSFPLIEPALKGFSERRLVSLAYEEAAWTVHYLEAKQGLSSIRGLLTEFAQGSTTEEAISRTFGMTIEEFDRAVWDWCVHEAPPGWPTEVRRYDREYGSLIQRSPGP